MVGVEICLDSHDFINSKFPLVMPEQLRSDIEEGEYINIIRVANDQYKRHMSMSNFLVAVLNIKLFNLCLKPIRESIVASKLSNACDAINNALQPMYKDLFAKNVHIRAKIIVVHTDVGYDHQTFHDLKLEILTGEDSREDIELSMSMTQQLAA
eukprot:TRINITY_DN5706_c0_g1_i1.p1 TRINITY_DN5706_c0_g1~~TRINITY_DN5706_c0_g1_i1.p1  ORF type:complete len:154 (+),score=48.80 TRINITY_DN5706_c0_g1_i1:75-536(+)